MRAGLAGVLVAVTAIALPGVAHGQVRPPTPEPNFAADVLPRPCALRRRRPVRGEVLRASRAGRAPSTSATPAPASGCGSPTARSSSSRARTTSWSSRSRSRSRPQDGYITRFKPNLVRADGTVPPIEQVHLHHGTWLSAAGLRQRAVLRRRRGEDDRPVPARLRHAGQGHRQVAAALHGPLGGQPADGDVYITYDIDFVPKAKGERARASSPPTRSGSTCARRATRSSTSSASFGGDDGTCTWPKEQCARVRPVRQDDRRPGRARQRQGHGPQAARRAAGDEHSGGTLTASSQGGTLDRRSAGHLAPRRRSQQRASTSCAAADAGRRRIYTGEAALLGPQGPDQSRAGRRPRGTSR